MNLYTTRAALALAVFFLLSACGPYQSKDFHGHWKGILLIEEGDTVAVDPSLIGFKFERKGYSFYSTLNYQESGQYHVQGDALFTTNTLAAEPKEKAVRIKYLKNDTLILGMKDNGRERELYLKRTDN